MKHYYGIPDEQFIRGDVPMTKREVRMAIMNEAHIEENSNILDIGAGTGSITIESALGAPKGHVWAIERYDKGIDLIRQNCNRFGVSNVTILQDVAPAGLDDVPPLDAVIIGGSAGRLTSIIDWVQEHLKVGGRLVVTAVTMETGQAILQEMKHRPFQYYGYQLAVNRYRKAGPYHLLDPMSPIFIVVAERIEQEV